MNSITNSEMKAGRFAKWAEARRKLAWIKARLAEGRQVCVSTMTNCTKYSAKHADMFSATKSGLYVQHGKHWLNLPTGGVQISAI